MAKIVWDETGEHIYETGIDRGVLYPMDEGKYKTGVAWNGLSSVTESPSGAEANDIYADNMKYLTLYSAEDFGATIEAYTYPDEFAACDGSAEPTPGLSLGQQDRKSFGLAYRTILGNDTEKNNHGYKIHLMYNATASPSERQYQTVNDSPEAISFSWTVTTVPTNVEGYKATAILTIDSTKIDKTKLKKLEDELYGTDEDSGTAKEAHLPTPEEVITLLK